VKRTATVKPNQTRDIERSHLPLIYQQYGYVNYLQMNDDYIYEITKNDPKEIDDRNSCTSSIYRIHLISRMRCTSCV